MSVLLESLAAGFQGEAPHRAVLEAVLRDGLPGPRTEAWKYTSLRALERRSFAPALAATPVADDVLAGIPAPRVVFVNGRHDPTLSNLADLPEAVELLPNSASLRQDQLPNAGFERGDAVFARLNIALADTSLLLRVASGAQITIPIHLVFIGAATGSDLAWHIQTQIELAQGAQASIVEHHLGVGAHAHLSNALTQVQLAADSILTHVRAQLEADTATLFTRTDAVLARNACYRRIDLELGAALSRHDLNVDLQQDDSKLIANGVLFAHGRRHLDTRLGVEHRARGTACELVWRGLGAGRGRAVFHGGIHILAGADSSDASLSNKNLLLSESAEIDTQPVLEIYADEVKAAHGATVGQLNPTALFYLRSRGLKESQASQLLTAAFCRETLAVIEAPDLRAQLEQTLDHALWRLDQV